MKFLKISDSISLFLIHKKQRHQVGDMVVDMEVGSAVKDGSMHSYGGNIEVHGGGKGQQGGGGDDAVPVAKRNFKKPARKQPAKTVAPTISVLFIDQTVGGELARRLQQVEDRLADVSGYRIRISETSGTQLCRLLPSTNPWGNMDCSRKDCYLFNQDECKANCKKRNVIYESTCILCMGTGSTRSPSGKGSRRWWGCTWGKHPEACLKEQVNTGKMSSQGRRKAIC